MTALPSLPTLSIAEPIVFPRDVFGPALQRHARLVDHCLDDFVAMVQEYEHFGTPMSQTRQFAGRIDDIPGEGPDLSVQLHGAIGDELALHRGIHRALRTAPMQGHFHLAVTGRGAVSLHRLRVVMPEAGSDRIAPRFEVDARDVLVEPSQQEHKVLGDWVVTRWRAEKSTFWSWAPAPRPPGTAAEAFDRLLALVEPQLLPQLWRQRGKYKLREPYVLVTSARVSGEIVSVFDRASESVINYTLLVDRTPGIGRVLREQRRPDVVPIYIVGGGYGALRWVDLRADRGEPHGLPELEEPTTEEELRRFEEMLGPIDAEDEAGVEATEAPGPKKRDGWSVVEEIMAEPLWEEMERVVTLGEGELSAEIAALGFEAEVERAKGRVLREAVVEAMVKVGEGSRGRVRSPSRWLVRTPTTSSSTTRR